MNPKGVDFVQEFSIEDKTFNEFRGVVRGGKNALRVAHVDMGYNEAARLQRTIEFGGRVFTVDANATADLEWDLWRIGYERDFVKTDHGLFGVIAEVDFNHVVADLRASDGVNTVTVAHRRERAHAGIRRHRARLRPPQRLDHLRVHRVQDARFPGRQAGRRGRGRHRGRRQRHMKDLDIYVTGSITRFFGIQGGYRWLSADYEIDRDLGDLSMKGPYLGAMIRF